MVGEGGSVAPQNERTMGGREEGAAGGLETDLALELLVLDAQAAPDPGDLEGLDVSFLDRLADDGTEVVSLPADQLQVDHAAALLR